MKQIQVVRDEDLNPGPPDYKSSALTTQPHRLLKNSLKAQLAYHFTTAMPEIVVFRKVPQFYFASVETVNYKQHESVRS